MSKTSRQEQRRRTERQEARQRRLELAIRAYKMPKMMSDMEGNKFLPGDPEYKKWVMLDLTEKAMIKAKQIYGGQRTELDLYNLSIGMGGQMIPAAARAGLEKLRGELGLEGEMEPGWRRLWDYLSHHMGGDVVLARRDAD